MVFINLKLSSSNLRTLQKSEQREEQGNLREKIIINLTVLSNIFKGKDKKEQKLQFVKEHFQCHILYYILSTLCHVTAEFIPHY